MPITPAVLPLSVQWWTASMVSRQIDVPLRIVYKRACELRDRGQLPAKRSTWTREQALRLANYTISQRREK